MVGGYYFVLGLNLVCFVAACLRKIEWDTMTLVFRYSMFAAFGLLGLTLLLAALENFKDWILDICDWGARRRMRKEFLKSFNENSKQHGNPYENASSQQNQKQYAYQQAGQSTQSQQRPSYQKSDKPSETASPYTYGDVHSLPDPDVYLINEFRKNVPWDRIRSTCTQQGISGTLLSNYNPKAGCFTFSLAGPNGEELHYVGVFATMEGVHSLQNALKAIPKHKLAYEFWGYIVPFPGKHYNMLLIYSGRIEGHYLRF